MWVPGGKIISGIEETAGTVCACKRCYLCICLLGEGWTGAGTFNLFLFSIIIILKILFIYSRDTHTHTHSERQREKQAPHGESGVGLEPRTPGSRPEPKADAQPLSHAGALAETFYKKNRERNL